VRLRRGLQVCRIDQTNTTTSHKAMLEHVSEAIYVVNGFYPAMKMTFEGAEDISFAVIEWDSSALSWPDLLSKVIGHSDPKQAASESIRGKFYKEWEELGLQAAPNRLHNCVHVSKSAFEGVAERLLWCKRALLFTDVFGSRLLSCNIPSLTVQNWLKNPTVQDRCVFDHMLHLDAEECLVKAQSLICEYCLLSYFSPRNIALTLYCCLNCL
jgi:hypothetical protein